MNRWNKFLEMLGLWEQEDSEEITEPREGKVVAMPVRQKLKVIVARPFSPAEGLELARYLRRRSILVVSMELLNEVDSSKLLNYLSGAVTALEGRCQSLGGRTYLLAPGGIELETAFYEDLKGLRGKPAKKEGK